MGHVSSAFHVSQTWPDIARLAELAALRKPKLYVINSVLHNPTSASLSATKAFQVLKIAEQHDITIVEDDISCDLHPGGSAQPATRIAALDQLPRVIYLSSFSERGVDGGPGVLRFLEQHIG